MFLLRRYHNSPIVSPADFKELDERNRLSVFRYLYGLTGGPHGNVEVLAADTFLCTWQAYYAFAGDMDSAAGWRIRRSKWLEDHQP